MPREVPVPLAAPETAGEHLAGPRVPVPEEVRDELADSIGAAGTATNDAARTEAARDWWPLAAVWAEHGQVAARPEVVVTPRSREQVGAVLAIANRHRIPVTPAAGRSGVGGGAVPVAGGLVLDCTALQGVVEVDDTSLLARVRAGTFGDVLESALRARGLTLGHWPQSVDISTVGGWIACRGAGQYSTRYGKIEDMVAGLEVVTASGDVVHTGGAPRAAVGPDLTQLFVGSEGTLGVVTEATLRLHPAPEVSRHAAYRFETFADGLDACRRVLRRGATPAVLRLYDNDEARQTYDVDGALLLVLDEGEPAVVDVSMTTTAEEVARTAAASETDAALVTQWLEHRNDVSALGTAIAAGLVVDTIEFAANWSRLPDVYEQVPKAIRGVAGTLAATAHCSHAYTDGGCLYFTFGGEVGDDPGAKDRYYAAAFGAAVDAARDAGAAISHHHGAGRNRAPYVRDALGRAAFDVLVGLKHALDPEGILNPGALGLPSPFLPEGWTWR